MATWGANQPPRGAIKTHSFLSPTKLLYTLFSVIFRQFTLATLRAYKRKVIIMRIGPQTAYKTIPQEQTSLNQSVILFSRKPRNLVFTKIFLS